MKTFIVIVFLLFTANYAPAVLDHPPMSAYSVPVQTQEAHPYPKDIMTTDNKNISLVSRDDLPCSSGSAIRAVFKHAPEGVAPRFFITYIVRPEDKSFVREILIEVKEGGIFVQGWVDRDGELDTYDYYASFDDLKAKYDSPCDIVKPKFPTQGT